MNMFNTYLNLIELDENYLPTSKNYIGQFISEDSENENNVSLKKLLLKRSQNNPKNCWNELLSWLYLQQKEYEKALDSRKSIVQTKCNRLKTNC